MARAAAPSFRYAARIHHAWRSLTTRTSAASPIDQRPSNTAFKTCNLACSFVFNVSPFID